MMDPVCMVKGGLLVIFGERAGCLPADAMVVGGIPALLPMYPCGCGGGGSLELDEGGLGGPGETKRGDVDAKLLLPSYDDGEISLKYGSVFTLLE